MRHVYEPEFRCEAVRLALSSGLSRERIVQGLGIEVFDIQEMDP